MNHCNDQVGMAADYVGRWGNRPYGEKVWVVAPTNLRPSTRNFSQSNVVM